MSAFDPELSGHLFAGIEADLEATALNLDLRRLNADHRLGAMSVEDRDRIFHLRESSLGMDSLTLLQHPDLRVGDIMDVYFGPKKDEQPSAESRWLQLELIDTDTATLYVLRDSNDKDGNPDHWLGLEINLGVTYHGIGFIKTPNVFSGLIQGRREVAIDTLGAGFVTEGQHIKFPEDMLYQQAQVNGFRVL